MQVSVIFSWSKVTLCHMFCLGFQCNANGTFNTVVIYRKTTKTKNLKASGEISVYTIICKPRRLVQLQLQSCLFTWHLHCRLHLWTNTLAAFPIGSISNYVMGNKNGKFSQCYIKWSFISSPSKYLLSTHLGQCVFLGSGESFRGKKDRGFASQPAHDHTRLKTCSMVLKECCW